MYTCTMRHPDGTPYWTPAAPIRGASASIDYSLSTGEAFSKGGTFLGEYTSLDACAIAFIDEIINTTY